MKGMNRRKFKDFSYFFMVFSFFGLSHSATLAKADSAPKNAKVIDYSKIPDAVPKVEPRSKSGNPSSYIVKGQRYYVLKSSAGYDKKGVASWYGTRFHGKLTASGDRYNLAAMTAASTELPLPTYLKVTNLDNGKTVIVKVTDRGPFRNKRLLDLSYGAAVRLGYAKKGTAHVRATAIDPTQWAAAQARNTHQQLASAQTQSGNTSDQTT